MEALGIVALRETWWPLINKEGKSTSGKLGKDYEAEHVITTRVIG